MTTNQKNKWMDCFTNFKAILSLPPNDVRSHKSVEEEVEVTKAHSEVMKAPETHEETDSDEIENPLVTQDPQWIFGGASAASLYNEFSVQDDPRYEHRDRDIKPRNLATRDYKNLFGVPLDLDTVIESEAEYTFVGSRAWMAPEVLAQNYTLLRNSSNVSRKPKDATGGRRQHEEKRNYLVKLRSTRGTNEGHIKTMN
ncbi:MAG: hypothetical protein Q9199_003600 [Rusavskia elegans]